MQFQPSLHTAAQVTESVRSIKLSTKIELEIYNETTEQGCQANKRQRFRLDKNICKKDLGNSYV